jgi:Fic family protein
VRQGLRRGTLYAIDPVALHFSVASERRRPVNYNFTLILGYRPNVTQWLSSTQRERLRAAGERIRALPPARGNTVLERLAIDLSWASSYLEGNTYTLLDTERLLVDGRAAAGHSAQETRMILNHKAALDYLREHAANFGPHQRDIRELHSLLASGLLADEADAGRIRRGIVEIGGSAYFPITPPQQLEEQLELILEKARAVEDAFEQSVFLLAFIPYLQPFIDVNKRVGRLAANIPLLKANVCPMSYRDMDKERYMQGLLAFYELNRPEMLARTYADAYERGVDRYAAIVEQGREVRPLEIQYFRELKQCVADYVGELADGKEVGHPATFARMRFNALPISQREWLAERVAEVVLALHEGNIIAWGVGREVWQRYAARVQR